MSEKRGRRGEKKEGGNPTQGNILGGGTLGLIIASSIPRNNVYVFKVFLLKNCIHTSIV